MKTLKIFLLIFLSIAGLLLLRFFTLPEAIKTMYSLSGVEGRYFMQRDKMLFDSSGVSTTVVHHGFFKFDKTLDKQKSNELLKILLDSSSYEWRETGTPEFSVTFVYLDAADESKGETIFSYDGQTYTYPATETQIKWGHLKDQPFEKVIRIIE